MLSLLENSLSPTLDQFSFDYDNTLIKYEYLYNEAGYAVDAVYTEPHHSNIKTMRDLYNQGCENLEHTDTLT